MSLQAIAGSFFVVQIQ